MTTYPEPTLIFENPELTVRAFSVSEMDNSVYLITMRATGEQVLIDPATEAEELYAFTLDALLKDCPQLELTDSEDRRVRVMEKEEDFNSLKPRAIGLTGILVTHGHWDHIRAIKELDHLTGAVTSAGAADVAEIKELEDYIVEEELTGGESFDFYRSDTVIRALHVPGHTPGSIVYTLETTWEDGTPATLLFTGDTLFPGGVGKTDSPLDSSVSSSPTCSKSSSAASKTTQSCYPATAAPPPSVTSAPTWKTGAPAAGKPRLANCAS